MLNSTSPTTLVFPVEDLGGLQLQGKALHGPLEQQPIFSKSAAARQRMRCALLACRVPVELVSPSRSNKLVEDLAGRLRRASTARRAAAACSGSETNWRAAEADSIPAPAKPQAPSLTSVSASLWMLGAAVEGEKSGPIKKPQDQKPLFFSKSAAARQGMRGALLTCEVPVELVTPNRTSWSRTLQVGCGRLPPPG